MTLARWRGAEYELLNVTEDGGYVLRDGSGDVSVFEESERERVEKRCERCGRWSTAVGPVGARWVCFDAECYDAELKAPGTNRGTNLSESQGT